LSVAWTLRDGNGGTGRRLALDWRESGVALKELETDAPPRGYGRELIEEALPYELDAETRLDFTEEGVRCRIELPLE
jgi:two-component sensor histidine kinase